MHAPTIRASAPLRISFVGGGTDFPHYYERHGGAVLSATIDHAAHVALTPRADDQVRIRSLDLGHLVEYRLEEGPVYDGVMDLPKAAIERFGSRIGIDVDIASDAPPGSGLGGSSALVTACVAALAMLEGATLSPGQVAHMSHAIERDDLGIAGGWQDQYAAAFGGFNLIEFGAQDVAVLPLDLTDETRRDLRAHLLLCYTGAVRTDMGLIDTQIRMYEEGREDTIVGMKRLHAMAYEMRYELEARHLDRLGPLLREAFEAKRLMNPRIAEGTPIERLLEAAHVAGAAGGKICGAGGGGYLLIACPPAHQPAVRASLERHGASFVDFAFRAHGVEATDGRRTWRPS
jgi:D-glycero-alpha-D-manno-heptose-7-phosphate kinase